MSAEKEQDNTTPVLTQTAESLEERGRTKGNAPKSNSPRTQGRIWLQQALERVREAAMRDRKAQFTSIWHLVYDVNSLREAFRALKRQSAAGIDDVTKEEYEGQLEENLADLSERLKRGAYHAKPVKRVYIPKPDGRMRPLGIPVLEDKIVQRATAEVLSAIYETDFHDHSFGFRPERSQHMALDTLAVGLDRRPLNWVLDADIRGFFDNIDHEWLLTFLRQRIADKRVLRHIQKWLKAGVFEDDDIQVTEYGTPQGGSISPLLGNIYLHYAFDNWAIQWKRKETIGDMLAVRFADDIVMSFEYREDAERFLAALQERMQRFHLELNMEKTQLIEFGRNSPQAGGIRVKGQPQTFDFLGFTHYCGRTKAGRFVVKRQTAHKKMRAKLQELRKELRRRMHDPVPEVGRWLGSVLTGHYKYYAVPFNRPKLSAFRHHVLCMWKRIMARRSQKSKDIWDRADYLGKRYLPLPKISHPYPSQRIRVTT